ncbi:MAG: signal peptidase I [Bacilli bacterium]|nr:signal peptidase I [Bacilli bacterium]MCI9434110.1 signal peptidase I [Bacilli bacterium]
MRDIKEFLKDAVVYVLIAVAVILIIKYVFSLEQVVGPSMEPNYRSGDLLFLNKISYKFKEPRLFDVVVIANDDTKYMIKRIIGLPGDTIEYKDNKLYINGEVTKEYFDTSGITKDFSLAQFDYDIIPDGYYFVLGDNRENSKDSRVYGLISREDIIGKVQFRIWPIVR